MSSAETKAARRAKFDGAFEEIRDELIEHFAGEGMPAEAIEWYRNVRLQPTCTHAPNVTARRA